MSFCIFSLKIIISLSNLKCASRRRRCCVASAASPTEQLYFHLQNLGQSLTPKVVVLESHFSPPTAKLDLNDCPRLATGFFLNPTLIATSVLAVGDVAPSHESRSVPPPPDESTQDSIQYKAHIARTLAFTYRGEVLTTRPLAVNFARGVAVLEVVQQPGFEPPRGCAVAESPPCKGDILLAVSRHQSVGFGMMIGNVRGGGTAAERSIKSKAPWPLDDGLGWIEHGWIGVGIGDPGPESAPAMTEVSATRIMGSPWFNLQGEVVGVASWDVKDKAEELSVGFAAPAGSIRAVAEYVKTKGGDDPLVMDTWIGSHVFYGDYDCVYLMRRNRLFAYS